MNPLQKALVSCGERVEIQSLQKVQTSEIDKKSSYEHRRNEAPNENVLSRPRIILYDVVERPNLRSSNDPF